MSSKPARLSVRLNNDEYQALKLEAQKYHLTVTSYIKLVILKKPKLLK